VIGGWSLPAFGGETIYATTTSGGLISFDSMTPGNILTGVPISGLQSNEVIQGIDFRPATGELFGVGSFSNLYTINTSTGAASLVGAGPFAPALNGAWFGTDFNPTIDRIRNDSDANQNLVLNPNSGTSTGVTDVFYPAGDPNAGVDPTVAHVSYTNSFAGATTTQLYAIDVGLDILATQANSAGTLGTVGSLGFDAASFGGFDISGASGVPYAILLPENSNVSNLYTIDLATGNASLVGDVAGGLFVTAMSVVPEPSTIFLLAAGGVFAVRRRR
jgi:hypothetical protein